jgi:hypothetical protein
MTTLFKLDFVNNGKEILEMYKSLKRVVKHSSKCEWEGSLKPCLIVCYVRPISSLSNRRVTQDNIEQ